MFFTKKSPSSWNAEIRSVPGRSLPPLARPARRLRLRRQEKLPLPARPPAAGCPAIPSGNIS